MTKKFAVIKVKHLNEGASFRFTGVNLTIKGVNTAGSKIRFASPGDVVMCEWEYVLADPLTLSENALPFVASFIHVRK